MSVSGLLTSKTVAISAIVFLCVGIAVADAQPATLNFANNQGSMTGYFTMDPTATTITDFNFSVTSGGGFPAYTYTTSNSVGALSSFFGKEVATFTANSNGFGLTQTTLLIIAFDCGGPSNCFPLATAGTSFTLDTISGELAQPDFSPYRQFAAGNFVNVTDPPGGISFNAASTITPGNTLYGESTATVPEPSSLLMLSSGLLAGVEMFRRRLRK